MCIHEIWTYSECGCQADHLVPCVKATGSDGSSNETSTLRETSSSPSSSPQYRQRRRELQQQQQQRRRTSSEISLREQVRGRSLLGIIKKHHRPSSSSSPVDLVRQPLSFPSSSKFSSSNAQAHHWQLEKDQPRECSTMRWVKRFFLEPICDDCLLEELHLESGQAHTSREAAPATTNSSLVWASDVKIEVSQPGQGEDETGEILESNVEVFIEEDEDEDEDDYDEANAVERSLAPLTSRGRHYREHSLYESPTSQQGTNSSSSSSSRSSSYSYNNSSSATDADDERSLIRGRQLSRLHNNSSSGIQARRRPWRQPQRRQRQRRQHHDVDLAECDEDHNDHNNAAAAAVTTSNHQRQQQQDKNRTISRHTPIVLKPDLQEFWDADADADESSSTSDDDDNESRGSGRVENFGFGKSGGGETKQKDKDKDKEQRSLLMRLRRVKSRSKNWVKGMMMMRDFLET